jgi:hypothetical protein
LQNATDRRQVQYFSLESKKTSEVTMLDFATINHLSRCHCVAICAVLVPTNLLLSTAVLLLTGMSRSAETRLWLSIAGTFTALLLIAHVASWWIVGVVAPATFILPSLGLLCTVINWSCIKYSSIAGYYIQSLVLSRFSKLEQA